MLVVFRSLQVNCGQRKLKKMRRDVIELKTQAKKFEWQSNQYLQDLQREKEMNATKLETESNTNPKEMQMDVKERFIT